METRNITVSEMVEILKLQKRGTFSNFIINTIPEMRKTDNPYFGQVIKVTEGNILLGGSYKTRVVNETNDVDFVPEKNKVGGHIGDGQCILENTRLGKFYLQYEWFEEVKPKSHYLFNGNPIEKRMFESFMGTYVPNKYGVNILSVNVNNIKEISFNHVRYILNTPIPCNPNPEPLKRKKKVVDEPMGQMNQ